MGGPEGSMTKHMLTHAIKKNEERIPTKITNIARAGATVNFGITWTLSFAECIVVKNKIALVSTLMQINQICSKGTENYTSPLQSQHQKFQLEWWGPATNWNSVPLTNPLGSANAILLHKPYQFWRDFWIGEFLLVPSPRMWQKRKICDWSYHQ